MAKLTLSLEDNLVQRIRARAAEEGKSLSRYLADLLERQMVKEDEYENSMQQFLALLPFNVSDGKTYPRRDELNERSGRR